MDNIKKIIEKMLDKKIHLNYNTNKDTETINKTLDKQIGNLTNILFSRQKYTTVLLCFENIIFIAICRTNKRILKLYF